MSSEGKYTNIEYQNFFEKNLSDTDPEIYKAINDELARQQQHIELIASENIVSNALLEAQGSVLTNKYAEGYPGKRYYNGCDHVDVAENLANERLKKLFNCKFANSQPHSGAQANGAVFLALLKPGDTIMGMSLNSGGHLTHGSKASVSGKWFNAIAYDVDKKTELFQAIGLTFGILASLLFCYKSGLIKPTENFKLMVFSATMGIALLYVISIMMNLFGGAGISLIHSNGLAGIGFSLFVVAIAALNLVLDFDFIEEGAEKGMPRYMEWYGAFSLMVTLIWLYMEILRLLAKLRSR